MNYLVTVSRIGWALLWGVLLPVVAFSQPATSQIQVAEFWLTDESDIDSNDPQLTGGLIDPNLVEYELLNFMVGDQIKLSFIAGASLGHHLEISLEFGDGTTVCRMTFQNGEVRDENGTLISESINDLDVFYFKFTNNQVQYLRNGESLRTPKSVAGLSNFKARYEQFIATNTEVVFELEADQMIGTNMSGDLVGNVYFPGEGICTSDLSYYGATNVNINLKHLDGTLEEITTTNATGGFSLTGINAGMIEMTASYVNTDHQLGIDAGDLTILDNHLAPVNPQPIQCPLLRIAADINQDGVINHLDRTILSDQLTDMSTAQPEIGTNWWFVPMPYVYPTDYHPDLNFVAKFWDFRTADASGQPLPFSAMLRFNTQAYTYLPFAEAGMTVFNSWMNTLYEWPFDANQIDCGEMQWGFYMIRPGDLNGSSATDLGWTLVTP